LINYTKGDEEMSRQQRIKSKSGYYHIMLRGNERKNVFNDDDDKQQFIEALKDKKQESRFYLHAFCLMDNHIHLLISEGTEDVTKAIKRITVSYVYYFNKKYKRVGHLFQDRFKSEVIEQDSNILCLARYIHQNPVKAGIVQKAADYRWSSYSGYLDRGNCLAKMLDVDIILSLFSEEREIALKKYEKYMNEKSKETFLDLEEAKEIVDEDVARELFQKMLIEHGLKADEENTRRTELLIKEFRAKTNLPIRKIAVIVGLNKDKVHKILKG